MLKEFKISVCGDYSIGKTSLINTLFKEKFGNSESTIGAAFRVYLSPEHNVKLSIWDTAGQERFKSLLPMYFRNAQILIYCWDATKIFNKENAYKLIDLMITNNENSHIYMVGTKLDLIPNSTTFTCKEAEIFVKDMGLKGIFYTSAKTGFNVISTFDKIINDIKDKHVISEPYEWKINRDISKSEKSCCDNF